MPRQYAADDFSDEAIKYRADRAEGVWASCQSCYKEFKLYYDEYEGLYPGVRSTLVVCSCESAGVYSIGARCPHCKHEESIL